MITITILITSIILLVVGYINDNAVCKIIGWVILTILNILFTTGLWLKRQGAKAVSNITNNNDGDNNG